MYLEESHSPVRVNLHNLQRVNLGHSLRDSSLQQELLTFSLSSACLSSASNSLTVLCLAPRTTNMAISSCLNECSSNLVLVSRSKSGKIVSLIRIGVPGLHRSSAGTSARKSVTHCSSFQLWMTWRIRNAPALRTGCGSKKLCCMNFMRPSMLLKSFFFVSPWASISLEISCTMRFRPGNCL